MSEMIDKMKHVFVKEELPLTAEMAWIETTYGAGSYKPIEKRIKDKQQHIKNTIKNKTMNSNTGMINGLARDFRCVVEIDEDLKRHVDEIFKPFIECGFNVINLSEHITELSDEYVYLISWKHAF